MRIAAISDLHGWLPPAIPSCDLLLIAGDVCPDAPGSGLYANRSRVAPIQARWLREQFGPWLGGQPAHRVVMCWGNHDYVGEFPDLVPPLPAVVLTDAGTEVGGLRIYAMPWTWFSPVMWAFDVPESTVEERVAQIPSDVDVLMTHGPPYGIRDLNVEHERTGSRPMARALPRLANLRLHVFGHIHEARGVEGRHHNVAVLDERYRPYRLPIATIDLEE
jgi:Icc-related predicted phosphoesterase